MAKISKLLDEGVLTASPVSFATVASGHVSEVTHVRIFNESAGPVTFTMQRASSSVYWFFEFIIQSKQSVDWYPRDLVLNAAQSVSAYSGTASALNMSVFGKDHTLG